jgi:adenylylsulfate kinase
MSSKSPPGFAIWLTGLPSAGKTTVARVLARLLSETGIPAQLIDSDELREKLTPHPTYSDEEREWFYGLIVFLAGLLTDNGVNVLIAATGPRRAYRDAARSRIRRFVEVYLTCSPDVCRSRDPKGLWRGAEEGKITALPGAGISYEPPESPEILVDTARLSAEEAAKEILHRLHEQDFFAG